MNNQYVVGMGEVLFDLLPAGAALGGAPANFAYHARQLGLRSCVVSALGDDDLGRLAQQLLADKGLEVSLQIVPFPTGTVEVSLDAEGIPSYQIFEGVAWDNIAFTPSLKELARDTVAFCFGSLAQRSDVSRRTINRFLEEMPVESCKIFDIHLRHHFYSAGVIESSLRACNILKINDEELEIVSHLFQLKGSIAERCRRLAEHFSIKIVVLTCGIQGSYVFTAGDESFLPTPCIEVADTVGAGDSFTATFVASFLCGRDIHFAHRLAVDVSAFVCTQHGAMPILPEKIRTCLK